MYNYIINPTTLQKISIFSNEGKKLLKTYTNNFIGGTNRRVSFASIPQEIPQESLSASTPIPQEDARERIDRLFGSDSEEEDIIPKIYARGELELLIQNEPSLARRYRMNTLTEDDLLEIEPLTESDLLEQYRKYKKKIVRQVASLIERRTIPESARQESTTEYERARAMNRWTFGNKITRGFKKFLRKHYYVPNQVTIDEVNII